MKTNRRHRNSRGFSLIELMVVVIILGTLAGMALPGYLSSVYASREGAANANARTISQAVQTHGVTTGSYDTTLTDYAADLGGSIPVNPCTGTTSGYSIAITSTGATIAASAGAACGVWIPTAYSVSL